MAAAAAASNVLQEVSVEENCIPECYVWPDELVSPVVAHDAFGEEEIPVIDLGGIEEALDHHHEREGDRDQYSSQYLRVVSLLSAACENWGFFQVVNHGVSVELLQRVQAMSERFCALPLLEKRKLEVHLAGDRLLGYGFIPKHAQASKRLWSEGLYLDISCVSSFAKTLWPHDPQKQHEFCETLEEYFRALQKLAQKITHLLINSLGLKPGNYDTYAPKDPALLRMNHYPPCPEPSKAQGLGAHLDPNYFTILHQGHVGGLQVLKDDAWVAVRPHPEAFAINVGDMLQVISNGRYKSAKHRAVVNKKQDRYSLAYFAQPPNWDLIVPPQELLDSKHPPLYKPFSWKEYLETVVQHESDNVLECFIAQPDS